VKKINCIKCNKIATKVWYDEHYCLKCWIQEADSIYIDDGKKFTKISKKLFIEK